MAHLEYWWQGNWSFSLIQDMIFFLVQLTSVSERFHVEVSLTASNLFAFISKNTRKPFGPAGFGGKNHRSIPNEAINISPLALLTWQMILSFLLFLLPPPFPMRSCETHFLTSVSSPQHSHRCLTCTKCPPGAGLFPRVWSLPGVSWQVELLLQREVGSTAVPAHRHQ